MISAQKQCCGTGDVRTSHRSAACKANVLVVAIPSGCNLAARSENVQARAVVAVASTSIFPVGSADSDGAWHKGRRPRTRIGVAIARRDYNHHFRQHQRVNRHLHRCMPAVAPKAHAHDCWSRPAVSHPVHGQQDASPRTSARLVKDLNRVKCRSLGHALILATDGARNVRAMAILIVCARRVICITLHHAGAQTHQGWDGPAAEVFVRSANACVKNVHVNSFTSCRIAALVGVVEAGAVVNAVQPPRRRVELGLRVYLKILVHEMYAPVYIAQNTAQLTFASLHHHHREAAIGRMTLVYFRGPGSLQPRGDLARIGVSRS
mmetsp:Transcript_120004/g.299324  ORF Transcript_120004/g.299324 Transcript_120004/m.299324 type:complete len:321 (+) Transcript_120004:370-1332(+)